MQVGGWAVAAVAVVLVVMGMARTQSSHQHRGLGRTCLPYKSPILWAEQMVSPGPWPKWVSSVRGQGAGRVALSL